MAIDRNLAQELSDNGLLLDGGAHISSGSGTPTHSGLKGDWYLKTADYTLWRLAADGTAWAQITAADILFNPSGTTLTATNVQAAIVELEDMPFVGLGQATAYVVGTTVIFTQYDSLLDSSQTHIKTAVV